MTYILANSEEFKHDIYELTRAFYPGEETTLEIDENCPGISVWHRDLTEEEQKIQDDALYHTGKSSEEIMAAVHQGEPVFTMTDTWSNSTESRKEKKSHMKRGLYTALSTVTGKELPWGTLTGIRPVRIPMNLLMAGIDDDQIADNMKSEYFVSPEKADLAIEIAKRERQALRPISYRDGFSLYVGIPFCPSICLYCSFSSYPYTRYGHLAEQYLKALFQDIDSTAEIFKSKQLNTIYIGGGTPTTLSADQLDRLMDKLENTFSYEHLEEFTVEAGRPDSITREKLEVLAAHGVSRISINPQSMQQKTLDVIGRKHTVDQIKESFHLAREIGFDNINMDLILGLPGETAEDVSETMKQIAELGPESVTIHSLAIKRAARLNQEKANYGSVSEEEMGKMMDTAASACRAMDLKPYYLYRQKNMAGNFENVGFAKVDKAGIYNILIMEEQQTIAAVGAGASTKLIIPRENRIERVENVKNVEQYISRIDEMIARKKEFFAKNPLDDSIARENSFYDDMVREMGHGVCVSNLAYRLGQELGLSEEDCEKLKVGGLLHDIGKLKLSSYMHTHGKSPLTVEQMKYVRLHPSLSYEIMKEQGYDESICEMVRFHHENYDGTGYPDNLAGENIPYMARVLRVCDVFAALTCNRKYRSAFDVDTAVELMIDEVQHFDLKVFLAFQRVVHEPDIEELLNKPLLDKNK